MGCDPRPGQPDRNGDRDVGEVATLSCHALRTLDAIHVASAQVLGDSLDTLVTYDKRMLDVARAEGLPAEAPGLF
jgi:predicted nucleic acid-binding protein